MNKIAVVSMVKNEEDIIESFARHACSFADKIFICDHKSTDRTRKILELLQSENLPIQIIDLQDQAYDHSKVMTDLMHRVIALGADIVIPMDADEFLLQSNGNAKSLRLALQNLDSDQCYTIPWLCFELVEPEIDSDKFLLSRRFMREKSVNNAPKVCIGAQAVKIYNLIVMKGGHHVLMPNGENFPEIVIGSEIFSAHFPKRSAGQVLSKTMGGWIGHILKFGRYHRFSYDWNEVIENYLERNILPNLHLKEPIETSELDEFRFELENRYTVGNIDPFKNIYQIAKSIAIEKFRVEILKRREIVRIYILFDGNVSATIDSLKSALAQTYPFRKIFITALSNKNINELFNSAEELNLTEEIGLIDPDDPVIIASGNGFAQFVTAGDKLHPDKIFRSIESLYMDGSIQFLSACLECASEDDSNLQPKRISISIPSLGDLYKFKDQTLLLKLNLYFSAGLSGLLFRQEVLTDDKNIVQWICSPRIDVEQMKFLPKIISKFGFIVFMKDELVEKSRAWTDEDRFEFEKIREALLQK